MLPKYTLSTGRAARLVRHLRDQGAMRGIISSGCFPSRMDTRSTFMTSFHRSRGKSMPVQSMSS